MTVNYRALPEGTPTHKTRRPLANWRRTAAHCRRLLPATWLLAQTLIAAAPAEDFDLRNWSLTLPDLNASVVAPSELTNGFSNAYFYTGSDDAMVFWAPVTGGTTAASDFPRSELREKLDPMDNSINWPAFGTHVLNARCRVTQLPSTGRVVIGQIHAYYGTAPPLVLLVYNDGNLEGLVKRVSMSTDNTTYALGRVALGRDIQYQLQLSNGVLSMTINGATTTVDVFATDPAWRTQTYYFKAGSYCLDNLGPSSEGAKVRFFQLSVHHESACVITDIQVDDVHCCLTWTSDPGDDYYVQGAASMLEPAWTTVSPSLRALGSSSSYCIPLPSPYSLFRVGMVAPVNP